MTPATVVLSVVAKVWPFCVLPHGGPHGHDRSRCNGAAEGGVSADTVSAGRQMQSSAASRARGPGSFFPGSVLSLPSSHNDSQRAAWCSTQRRATPPQSLGQGCPWTPRPSARSAATLKHTRNYIVACLNPVPGQQALNPITSALNSDLATARPSVPRPQTKTPPRCKGSPTACAVHNLPFCLRTSRDTKPISYLSTNIISIYTLAPLHRVSAATPAAQTPRRRG